MKNELLVALVEQTFARIAYPLQGNGVYAEIQNAINEAYSIGKTGDAVPDQSSQSAGR